MVRCRGFAATGDEARAGPALLAGLEEGVRRGRADTNISLAFNITFRDSLCNPEYASKVKHKSSRPRLCTPLHFKAFIDSLPLSGTAVLFGPTCDYTIAPVARLLKFYNTPLVTGGGMSVGFGKNRTERDQEFFLLTRTGHDFGGSGRAVSTVLLQNNLTRVIFIFRS